MENFDVARERELEKCRIPFTEIYIRQVNKDWKISHDGTLTHRREKYYVIAGDRLTETDWIAHMRTKGWCDMNTFLDAYFRALKKRGIEKLTITIR